MADDMKLQIMLEAINDTGPGMDALLKSVQDIAKNVQDMSKSFGDFFKTIPSGMESVTRAVEEVNVPLDSAQKALTSLYDEASKGETAAAGLAPMENEVNKIKETIVATEDELRKLTDLSSLKTATGGAVDASMLSASQLAGLYGKQSGQNVIVPGEKKEGGGIFSNEGSMNLMYAGMTLGAAALPLDTGLKAAISQYGQFSQAMANVNSMANMSTQQLAAMSQQVINLSKAVPIGPVQLANALYGVVGAGVPAADAMNFLKTAADASVAGQVDLTTATNALVYVMGSYGLQAKDMGKISDEMFAANAAGAMTFQQFASSLGTVAGAAAQAGVPFNQIAAATAALTNDGISAQRATLGLRALLMGIVAPTKGASKEAKALGIEWDQNALKSKGLTGMLQEAMQATHGNAQELKKLIPNIAGWTVAVDLGGKGAQSFKNAMDQMNNSTGATARAMQAQQQGFEEQINTMKASVQSASIAFAGTLAPAITKVANTISNLAKWFSNLSPSTQKFIGDGTAAAAVFLTLGAGALMFLSGIGQAAAGFETLGKTIKPAIESFKVFSAATKDVGISEAFMDAMSPVGWIALIGAAVAGIAVLIITHWSQVRSFLENTWNAIKGIASTVWNGVKDFFQKWGVDLLAAFVPVIGLPILIAQHWQQIQQFASQIWNGLVSFVQNLWTGFTSWMSNAAQAFANAIVNAFNWMYNHNYYFKDLVDFIRKMWQTIQQDATKIWNAITTFFGNIWNGIKKVADAFWTAEVTGWENIWKAVVKAVDTIFTPIEKFFEGVWNSISGTASSMWNSIKSTMSGLWSGIVGDAEKIFNGLGDFFKGLWTQAEQWGSNLIHMVAQGIMNAAHEVENAVGNVAKSIASHLGFHSPTEKGPGADADTWMPNMMKMFVQGIQAHIPELETTLQGALASPFQGATAMVSGSMNQSMVLGASAYGTGGGLVIQRIDVHGNVARNEKELGDIVSRAIWEKTRMLGKF